MSERLIWVLTGGLAIVFGGLVGFGGSGAPTFLIVILAGVIVIFIGSSITREVDADWLPRWIVLGFGAKLAGTVLRYYILTSVYGVGDAFRYYRAGTDLATEFRAGSIPELTGAGSLGTQVVEWFTGALFTVVTPSLLGGFLLFATVAFMGQLMLYAAFRRWAAPHQLKPYAILIFLLPTYAFWPSSIGKDSLVVFALGAAAYAVSRALEAFQIRWLFLLALSLVGVGLIRIHIAGLVAGSFVLASLLSRVRNPDDPGLFFRRILTLGGGVAAAALIISLFPDLFGVDLLSSQDRDSFTSDILRRTSEDGTVAGGASGPASLLTLPDGLALVLFRPWFFEATELQHYLAAAETGLIAAFTIWKLPAVLANLKRWRSNAYVVFSSFYVLGFAVAFSVVRNLGIIARQRGQVLAFFLVVVIALGWEDKSVSSESKSSLELPAPPMRIGSD